MCQRRCQHSQIPWAGQQSRMATQPVGMASVATVLWHPAPSVGHKVRNRGSFHTEREQRSLRVTLYSAFEPQLKWTHVQKPLVSLVLAERNFLTQPEVYPSLSSDSARECSS